MSDCTIHNMSGTVSRGRSDTLQGMRSGPEWEQWGTWHAS